MHAHRSQKPLFAAFLSKSRPLGAAVLGLFYEKTKISRTNFFFIITPSQSTNQPARIRYSLFQPRALPTTGAHTGSEEINCISAAAKHAAREPVIKLLQAVAAATHCVTAPPRREAAPRLVNFSLPEGARAFAVVQLQENLQKFEQFSNRKESSCFSI